VGPYALSKAASERRVVEAAAGSGMCVTILRLATLYGEGDRGNVQRLLQLIARGRFVWIGTGTNRKSLIHVDDAARACVQPILSGGDAVETFNVSAPPVAMREVVEELGGALGKRLPGWHVPATLASGMSSTAALLMPSIGRSLTKWMSDEVYPAEKFERRFGFATRVSLRDGIARQVAWWRARTGEAGQS
jgi:nucleoside-diphosphate-sugar epimerase